MAERDDLTPVVVAGAGQVPWKVLRWLRAADRFGVRFAVRQNRLVVVDVGEFKVVGLPPEAKSFVAAHNADLRRVLAAVPPHIM